MIDFTELSEPFPPEDIKWRLGATNAKKNNGKATKGIPLAYIDARHVMNRLDAFAGPQNWKDSYTYEAPRFTGPNKQISGRVTCTIYIKIDGEWIGKSDGAGETDVEGDKGGISDAFKRAGVKWGIGRYLYSLPTVWVDVGDYNKFTPPLLPKPVLSDRKAAHDKALRKHIHSVGCVTNFIERNLIESAAEAWQEIPEEDQRALWLAPSKGGIFTTEERKTIKEKFSAALRGE